MEPTQPSSDAMKALKKTKGKQAKYPWRTIELGYSFRVSKKAIKLASLETLAFRQGKKLGRVFWIVDHPEYDIYEVGFKALREKPLSPPPPMPPQAPTPVASALARPIEHWGLPQGAAPALPPDPFRMLAVAPQQNIPVVNPNGSPWIIKKEG